MVACKSVHWSIRWSMHRVPIGLNQNANWVIWLYTPSNARTKGVSAMIWMSLTNCANSKKYKVLITFCTIVSSTPLCYHLSVTRATLLSWNPTCNKRMKGSGPCHCGGRETGKSIEGTISWCGFNRLHGPIYSADFYPAYSDEMKAFINSQSHFHG